MTQTTSTVARPWDCPSNGRPLIVERVLTQKQMHRQERLITPASAMGSSRGNECKASGMPDVPNRNPPPFQAWSGQNDIAVVILRRVGC